MFIFKRKDLIEYHLEIHGMRCGMCESHINSAIRRYFSVYKVKSNRFKNETIIYSKVELDEGRIKEVISSTGYELKGIRREN